MNHRLYAKAQTYLAVAHGSVLAIYPTPDGPPRGVSDGALRRVARTLLDQSVDGVASRTEAGSHQGRPRWSVHPDIYIPYRSLGIGLATELVEL